eukprot:605228-Pyramimonas_sp.AAC.2
MCHSRRSLGASGVTNVSPSQEPRSKRCDECVTLLPSQRAAHRRVDQSDKGRGHKSSFQFTKGGPIRSSTYGVQYSTVQYIV